MNAAVKNYDELMQKQIKSLDGKKKLLLHCCCAPCASACIERLKERFDVTVLFYNPNIESGEYERRKDELKKFVTATGWADFLDCDHDEESFSAAVCGLEKEKEGGARCLKCFDVRLKKTARLAEDGGFDFFATTLTVSPMKNAYIINTVGEKITCKARWLYSDFKKRGGYLRSCELSREYGLYRQNYCGCIYSRSPADNS